MSTTACMHYCWHSVDGYSKHGVYRGNGYADGPYVNLGFKPRWILIRAASRTGDWKIFDKVRDPQNPCTIDHYLNPNAQSIEGSEYVEFLSNGFKITSTLTDANQNSQPTSIWHLQIAPTNAYAGASRRQINN